MKLILEQEYNPELIKDNNSSYDPKKYIKSKLLKNKKINYEHTFVRNTKTFGKVPAERQEKFINIKDNLLNDNK